MAGVNAAEGREEQRMDREPPSSKLAPGVARHLALLLGFLALVAAGCIAGFVEFYGRAPAANPLDFEIAKALLQMGVVSVVAAIVALLAFNYQHRAQANQRELEVEGDRRYKAEQSREQAAASAAEKERDERRQELRAQADAAARRADYVDELLKSTLTRITESYNAAKRARRQLRALARFEATSGEVMIRASVYDEWMARLNDAQLDLETVKRDVDVSRGAYPSAKEMFECVKRMEDYLRDVRKEYEEARWKVQPDAAIPLASLLELTDFLGKKKASKKFSGEFIDQYATVRRMVRANLLNVRFTEAEQPPAPGPA